MGVIQGAQKVCGVSSASQATKKRGAETGIKKASTLPQGKVGRQVHLKRLQPKVARRYKAMNSRAGKRMEPFHIKAKVKGTD